MASISTRSSVLAIKKETTEGTPVFPSASTDYVALQDDFSAEPAFDVLENAELKASIGVAKPILGAENPTVSFSHYLRASGTVGTAPNYGLLLESCLGAVSVASTEYDTTAGSTVSALNVGVGEGATFERGEALLIKDGVNGTRIRCLDGVTGDALNLGFQVPAAPASGVNLGRAVLYKPANSDHPTLTLNHYVGNGGATQMMAGSRVVSADFEIGAGELINASYSLEGVSFYFNPIEITTSTRFLDFTDDDGTWAASVAAKVYKDPHDLASALTTAMNSVSPGETHLVVYSDTTGQFTITSSGAVLSLLWNSGANTANTIGTKLGFLVAADDTGATPSTGYTSDNAISFASPQVPSFDNADPLAAKDNEVMVGDTDDYLCFKASSVSMSIATPKSDILSVCSESGKAGSIVASREVTISITALLEKYDADKWRRFRQGSNTKFQYSFGIKEGGNWVAGKAGALFVPTATITSFVVEDADSLAVLSLELSAYVNSSGQGEVYVNFV